MKFLAASFFRRCFVSGRLQLCFAALVLTMSGSTASAQSASGIINLFNGLVGTAITQATIGEWRKVRTDELQCIDQRLRQGGFSIEGAIRQGIMPDDPRLASVRLDCRADVGLNEPDI